MRKKIINTRIRIEDFNRLEAMRVKYGFTYTNQIIEYLVYCFLRVADPQNDPITSPVPKEIKEMFALRGEELSKEIELLRESTERWMEMARDSAEMLSKVSKTFYEFLKYHHFKK